MEVTSERIFKSVRLFLYFKPYLKIIILIVILCTHFVVTYLQYTVMGSNITSTAVCLDKCDPIKGNEPDVRKIDF